MIKHTLSSVLLCAGLSCLAQHGPIGRAIKATQVVADPADMSYTTNTVVQKILEDIASRLPDPAVTGRLRLYTELYPCPSCRGVMQQYIFYYELMK